MYWNNEDVSVARVLVKILVEDPLEVPRSLIIKMGRELDGEGRSWTVPVYIFNSELLGAAHADEDDPPQHTMETLTFSLDLWSQGRCNLWSKWLISL
jgi:hypothetical protein